MSEALVAVLGSAIVNEIDAVEEPGVDANRLRRMDRFGRAGFLAGHAALRDAGFTRPEAADPRTGVVFGTAFGCRDSVTDHADLVAKTTRVEELRPALFAQTVHNTVNGELGIEWNLGGVSEVLVSGRCAGLEAILLAHRRLAAGAADRVVAGGAEGLNAAMREAWERERERYGPRAGSVSIQEAGAALFLSRVPEGDEAARGAPLCLGGVSLFEEDPARAADRLTEALAERFGGVPAGPFFVASPDLDGAFGEEVLSRLSLPRVGFTTDGEARAYEFFGAAGPVGAVYMAGLLATGMARRTTVVVRDPEGPTAALVLGR